MRATSTQTNEDRLIQAFQRARRIPQLAQHDRSVHGTFLQVRYTSRSLQK